MLFLVTSTLLAIAGVIDSIFQLSHFHFTTSSILCTYVATVSIYVVGQIVVQSQFSPFRDLPIPDQGPWYKRLLREPGPAEFEQWIGDIPNDGIIRYYGAFNRESLFLTRPDAIYEFLQTGGYKFHKSQAIRNIIEQITGHGLLVANGDVHKYQRKALNPAFKFKWIRDSYLKFWSHTIDLVRVLEQEIDQSGGSRTIDADTYLQRVTFDIIADTGFGLELNAVHNPNNDTVTTLAQANSTSPEAHLHRVLAFVVPRWVLWNIPTKRRYALDQMVKVSHDIARPLIEARRDAYSGKQITSEEMEDDTFDGGKREHSDILATLLRSPLAHTFDDRFLASQAITFLLAGQDTTSVATTWALYLLTKHLDVQMKLREEIRANIPSPDNKNILALDAQVLESMPLLYAVCNEALRLYSPSPQIRRMCVDSTAMLQGRRIPVGTIIVASQWACQRSKHLWGDDVLEFKPERFLRKDDATGRIKFDITGGLKGQAAVYGNMPFGAGHRNCIGERFARAEFAALLAGLIGRLQWLPDPNTPDHVEVNWGVVSKPAQGLKFQVQKVEGW